MPWIGPVIGGGLGLLGSIFGPNQTGTQTTTQANFPSGYLTGGGNSPQGVTPGYTDLLYGVNRLLGGNNLTGGTTRAANREAGAYDALWNRGQNQNPLTGAGTDFIQRTLGGPIGATGNTQGTAAGIIGGAGLSPDTNPYLQQTFNRAADLTRGRLASEFAGSGRDLGASQPARSEELQTLASNIFGGNYQAERGRQAALTGQSLGIGANQQQGALNSALPFANQDYTNIQAMIQGASDPVNNLINRISAIAPAAGGTASASQPIYSNPIAGALGGAALGSQFGSFFQNMPWGGLDPTKTTLGNFPSPLGTTL